MIFAKPTDDRERTVRSELADISGREPPTPIDCHKIFIRLLFVLVVPGGDVRAADKDLSLRRVVLGRVTG